MASGNDFCGKKCMFHFLKEGRREKSHHTCLGMVSFFGMNNAIHRQAENLVRECMMATEHFL